MSITKRINVVRRAIMHGITKSLGSSHKNLSIDPDTKFEVKSVLVCRPNHRLGNQLLMTPLIQEIESTFPDCKIDLFVKGGLADIIFKNYTSIGKIIHLPKKHFKQFDQYVGAWFSVKKNRYDLVINVDKGSSSGRIATTLANAKVKMFGDDEELAAKFADQRHMAKHPVYGLRNLLSKLGIVTGEKPIPLMDIRLTAAEIAEGKEELKKYAELDKKTICLFTYATGKKCYEASWWLEFYDLLKKEFPDCNIMEMLPVENISSISFKAPSFYSKDIRQMGSLIANTDVFVAADSGIMHLASAAKTTVVGLFQVTELLQYEPYNPHSVAIDTNQSDQQAIIGSIRKILSEA